MFGVDEVYVARRQRRRSFVESSRPRPKVRVQYVPSSSYEGQSYRRPSTDGDFSVRGEHAGHSRGEWKGPQHYVPPGLNVREWDREERPIIVGGSVFDANSLGKWIFDWSCAVYGKGSPIADIAGDLWLALIRLAGRLGELGCRRQSQVVVVLLREGEELWHKYVSLVDKCNKHMLSSKEAVRSKQIGQKSVARFLGMMFGRDRCLEFTEGLIQSIRSWNCEYEDVFEPMR
jgi:hypothetical protein